MIKNAIAKKETIATTRTGQYQFKKVPETIDFLLVLLVLGESRTNRRLLTIALCHIIVYVYSDGDFTFIEAGEL